MNFFRIASVVPGVVVGFLHESFFPVLEFARHLLDGLIVPPHVLPSLREGAGTGELGVYLVCVQTGVVVGNFVHLVPHTHLDKEEIANTRLVIHLTVRKTFVYFTCKVQTFPHTSPAVGHDTESSFQNGRYHSNIRSVKKKVVVIVILLGTVYAGHPLLVLGAIHGENIKELALGCRFSFLDVCLQSFVLLTVLRQHLQRALKFRVLQIKRVLLLHHVRLLLLGRLLLLPFVGLGSLLHLQRDLNIV
ncbi:hypothetical protein AGDE_13031 [Angomonas deanei]|uniref:Uncharacterized protein n=1 Tax=Angomonas deanei TaxID=59799 RepID=A0A7G2C7V7_9TRYP|nr:hypothetical protein AGDE_13031 [Angomonas deanei]CAD2215669.1 hypothetical protein, conserved [Angomonas deanei]|eukprot:EPY22849.1 hypothetical protein AGDE_13031 [Angomonas deanei]